MTKKKIIIILVLPRMKPYPKYLNISIEVLFNTRKHNDINNK